MFVRFAKRFEYKDPQLGKVTYPRGWAGELDETVHALATEASVLVRENSAGAADAALIDADDTKSDALIAAEKKVADLKKKVAEATGDEKTTAVADLKVALAEVKLAKAA